MALWERARRLAVDMSNCFEREWRHDGSMEREAEAAAKMALRDAVKPYRELCDAATAFVKEPGMSVTVTPTNLGKLARLVDAAEKYTYACARDSDSEQKGKGDHV